MPTNARVNVQKDNVTDALSSSVVVPTGKALTIASGGSLTAQAGSIVSIPASGITGLGTMSTQNANNVAITGGSITGITDLAVADGGTGASNAADARVNLGVSTTGTSILYGDGAGSFSNVTIGSGVSFTSGTLSATGTGGTVTSVSVTTANGVSGTVTDPTTTPAISLTLGAITPTSVNSVTLSGSATPTLAVTGASAISGTNTGDQTISITGDVTAAGSQNTLTSTVTRINGQALATLATGILKNTTSTGVPSIAVAADFPTLNQNTTGNAATATNVAITGVTGLGTGVSSFLQTPTSANLSSMVIDETGSGNLVFANSPVLVTPNLDTPSVLTLTNATGLPLATGVTGTLPVANGGTGVTTSTGTGSTVLSASPTFTGTPAAPTAANGTNTTQIATTQYVQSNRGDKYLTTSNSTNTINNGNGKIFNCAIDLSYIPTQAVTIVYDINNHMHATVISYNITTGVMVVDVDTHTGSGTYSAWTINLGGLTSAGGALLSVNNLSDVASVSTSRANLGVTATGQDTTYLYRTNNLSDLDSVSTARTNLGLGTMATQNSTNVSISGGTLASVTITTPTISSITNTGTLTLPNQTDTLVGRATTDTLTNKTLTSPVMTTPSLGVASATSVNKVAITAPATGSTLTIVDGATLTASATATVSGTNTGDQTISITGDVTASGSTGVLTSTVTKINGTSLAGLATGILKNTTGTGVPSIALSGSDYAPATSGSSILYGNSAGGFSNVTIGSGVAFSGGTLSATGNGGTVTSVSVTTANGVSGTVTNPTTTPAISLTLGAITPTSVSSGSGAFTSLASSGAIRITTNNVYYAGTTTGGANQNLIGIGADDNTAIVSKSGNTIKMDAGGSTVGTFSATGLAITGALSSTTQISALSAGADRTKLYSVGTKSTIQFGSPAEAVTAWQYDRATGVLNLLDGTETVLTGVRASFGIGGLAVTGNGDFTSTITSTGAATQFRAKRTGQNADFRIYQGVNNTVLDNNNGDELNLAIAGTYRATITSTGLAVVGTLSATGAINTFGAGGTGTNSSGLVLSGGSGSGGGGYLTWHKNAVASGYVGSVSSVFGGASNDTLLYSVSNNIVFRAGSAADILTVATSGAVGVGTASPGANTRLAVVGGAITISAAPFTADASIHINTVYGNAGRLTQMHPTGNSLNALNLMASTDGAGNNQWWSWGVNANKWTINPGTSFGTGFTIDGSGNVGIGTASPAAKLHISGTNGGIIFDRISTDVDPSDSQGSIYVKQNGISNYEAMMFRATGYRWQSDTGTDRMLIDSSGNVGIGTTAPATRLSVVTSASDTVAAFTRTGGNNCYITMTGGSASDYTYEQAVERTGANSGNAYFGGAANTVFSWRQGGYSQLMRLDSTNGLAVTGGFSASGMAGFGCTSAVAGSIARITALGQSSTTGVAMAVAASDYLSTPTYTASFLSQNGNSQTGTTCGLSNAGLGSLYFQNTTAGLIWTNGGAPLVFGVQAVERMRISNDGNVGIGTSSAQARLQVTSVSDGAQVIVRGAQTSNYQFLLFRNGYHTENTTAGLASVGWQDTGGAGGNLFLATTANASGVNGVPTIRLFITQAGNVGIGNTNPGYKLDVTGSMNCSGALSKGSGSFRIEHPLPEKSATHQLVHSFIEGPQADLIYRGKVVLVDGKASVNIDTAATMTEGTFEVLCRDVQCFTTNETGWTAVRGKVTGNTLTIEAKEADCVDEISWMVIGERQDPHMMETDWTDDNGKVIVEPLNPVTESK